MYDSYSNALPIAVRDVAQISSNSSLDSVHRNINAPVAAGALLPDTGASKKRLQMVCGDCNRIN